MKRCPGCNRTFTDETLRFCLYDGKELIGDTQSRGPGPAQSAPPASPNQPYPNQPYPTQPYPTQPRRKSPWGWIVGGIALVLLVLRVATHPATQPQRAAVPDTGQPAVGQPGTGQTPSDSSLRDTLVSAIRQADDAEVQAFRSLDPAPLYPAYTGAALTREITGLQALKNGGISQDSRLINQDFGTFKVTPDRTEAQVDVTETWSSTTYSTATHQPVRTTPSNVVPQTVFLKRSDSGWIVENIQPKTP